MASIILASFVAYVLRTNVSIVGEALIQDLGITTEQLGVVSAFAGRYASAVWRKNARPVH